MSRLLEPPCSSAGPQQSLCRVAVHVALQLPGSFPRRELPVLSCGDTLSPAAGTPTLRLACRLLEPACHVVTTLEMDAVAIHSLHSLTAMALCQIDHMNAASCGSMPDPTLGTNKTCSFLEGNLAIFLLP